MSEDALGLRLALMPSASERKRWLIGRYAAGKLSADQVSFWFYVYDLRAA